MLKKVEKLANLSIDSNRFTKIANNLISILEYVDILGKADVANMPDSFNASGLKNVTVEDKVVTKDNLTNTQALQNAKRKNGGFFEVDKVIEY